MYSKAFKPGSKVYYYHSEKKVPIYGIVVSEEDAKIKAPYVFSNVACPQVVAMWDNAYHPGADALLGWMPEERVHSCEDDPNLPDWF